MALIDSIAANFFKFDFLIILLAVFTSCLYYLCWQRSRKLNKILLPKGNLALGRSDQATLNRHYDYFLQSHGETEILSMRKEMNSLYVLFINICSLFPLLGLLGTVVALIPMVQAHQTDLFFDALTSTFWGIVFAIIFKGLNGFLQASVEENTELINTYLLREDSLLTTEIESNEVEGNE
ncbi:MotA/TolQ/ExbB proton channel family protein [Hutsoniella sourekii]